ncbi:hypothetical protein J3R83DRAFT_701 [Lanmaoa asiatica]|nr:hypothetical protein J3R83DRAFT_701 [Lanmaoa asiatica]
MSRVFGPALWGCGSSPEDLLREYRRLDDTITMRLNRSNAQFRDRDREGTGGKGSIQDRACAYIWMELLENWKRRTEIVEYCVNVVDQSMSEKHKVLDGLEGDAKARRKTQAELFADEVKVGNKFITVNNCR